MVVRFDKGPGSPHLPDMAKNLEPTKRASPRPYLHRRKRNLRSVHQLNAAKDHDEQSEIDESRTGHRIYRHVGTNKGPAKKNRSYQGKVWGIFTTRDNATHAVRALISGSGSPKPANAKGVRPATRNSPDKAPRVNIVKVDAASAGEPAASAYVLSAKSKVILLGVAQREADLKAAGGAYELSEVRALLQDISPQAVTKRVAEGSMLAVPGPEGKRRFPAVQFLPDGRLVPDLKSVIRAFPSESPWMLLNYLVQPDPALNKRRPIDVLKAGDLDAVVQSARRIGFQGG